MSTSSRWIIGIVVVALVLWGVFALDKIDGSPANMQTIKIGVVVPLTGSRADAGENIRNALTIATEEINTDSTRKIDLALLYEDSKYDPPVAVSAFQKLRDFDKVRYVIGAHGSSETLAIAPIAEQAKILLITPGSQTDALSSAGDYIFRLIHNTAQEAPRFAPFVAKKMKGDTIHFLALNTEITPSYLKYFEPALQKAGKKVGIVEKFDAKATDFRSQLVKIKAHNPTDIFLITSPKLGGIILKQASELGLKPQFYNIAVEGPEFLTATAEELLYPYSYDVSDSNTRARQFYTKYKERSGKEPVTEAANAYDAAYLLSDCFEKNGDDVEKIKTCLYTIKDYQGASGKFSIDLNGDAVKPLIVKTVKDGKFVKHSDLE